jgi:GNAT superfamily N-acetyltransferase
MKSTPQHKLSEDVTCRPLTRRNWSDLEQLFGPRGASAGCWCMWWRLKRSEWEKQKGEKNRSSFENIVASGAPTGVLAYLEKQPVGWCAIAPRTHYPVLERSRILSPIDDQPVWSVTCFFIARPHRQSGLTAALLRAAVEYAVKKGAKVVEGYPTDPRGGSMPEAFAWTGFASAFRKAGFKEVTRRSAGRPIMRYYCS